VRFRTEKMEEVEEEEEEEEEEERNRRGNPVAEGKEMDLARKQ
jgi:hypothetical protein